ncbi:hypothetical protein, partial [Trueperella pyogenes]|nr:hypothetical protein [Trueperella pyogenes]
PPASNPTAAGTTPPASTMKKLTIRIDEKLLGRVRAAYLHELMTGSAGGKASLGAWVAARLEDVVKASEAAHNNGQSYTPVDGGILPRGPLQ